LPIVVTGLGKLSVLELIPIDEVKPSRQNLIDAEGQEE
jgi:hypothetical protein